MQRLLARKTADGGPGGELYRHQRIAVGDLRAGVGQLAFQVGDGGFQQFGFGIETAELEVVCGHFGVKGQIYDGHIGGDGLSGFAGGCDSAADAAPEVRLPTGLAGDLIVVVAWVCC